MRSRRIREPNKDARHSRGSIKIERKDALSFENLERERSTNHILNSAPAGGDDAAGVRETAEYALEQINHKERAKRQVP